MATILLIEDDPQSARLVIRVLERAGHQVIHASEGLNGLKIASEQPVDLVLLDLGLPDVGGHTIAAMINRIPGDIPIVAVTGRVDPITQQRAMRYGCDGYITKPIDVHTFADQIASFIQAGVQAPRPVLPENGGTEPGENGRHHTIV